MAELGKGRRVSRRRARQARRRPQQEVRRRREHPRPRGVDRAGPTASCTGCSASPASPCAVAAARRAARPPRSSPDRRHRLDPALLAAGGVRLETAPDGDPSSPSRSTGPTRATPRPRRPGGRWPRVGDALPGRRPRRRAARRGPVFSAGHRPAHVHPRGRRRREHRWPRSRPRDDDRGAPTSSPSSSAAFTWWHDRDVVTVAAVQGAAVGAGFQLALACDLRVCSTAARFAMRETSLGPGARPGRHRTRSCGPSATPGPWRSAPPGAGSAPTRPLRLGLASAVVEPDDLDETVGDLVAALLAAPRRPPSRATKARAALGARPPTPSPSASVERAAQIPLLRGAARAAG